MTVDGMSDEVEGSHEQDGALEAVREAEREAEAAMEPGMGLLYDIELEATLQFGSRELALREVLELGPGDVVELDRHVSEPVDLVVGDRIVARGEVVVVNGNFAFLVNEVAAPQMRLESIRCLF
jgi:flagellar motor switch protein FliN/FliY